MLEAWVMQMCFVQLEKQINESRKCKHKYDVVILHVDFMKVQINSVLQYSERFYASTIYKIIIMFDK